MEISTVIFESPRRRSTEITARKKAVVKNC